MCGNLTGCDQTVLAILNRYVASPAIASDGLGGGAYNIRKLIDAIKKFVRWRPHGV